MQFITVFLNFFFLYSQLLRLFGDARTKRWDLVGLSVVAIFMFILGFLVNSLWGSLGIVIVFFVIRRVDTIWRKQESTTRNTSSSEESASA
ncbi:hypothetical protein [Alicyclobacillus dauci]|uniref:Uncharacterized protein n=1 Tax=Alicyclobacillus dauci TaxID=1475485 RepID=A0ABY6Z6K6_9BACL|nr:hypothetical protein [Alicyclobacillus dauci]WAH38308.1 hypothetical protein NZD86_07445 [Alicyclobacillus dauci]